MKEKRFLSLLYISFILALGILLSVEFSGYGQAQWIDPNSPIRSSSLYLGYPTSYIGVLGTGLYPGLGLGLIPGYGLPPLTQQISLAQITPLTSSTLDAFSYRDPVTMYNTQASTFTNPFATYGSTAMVYASPFSQAAANTMSYADIFGVSLNQGQGFYMDPFYATGGKYINYASPVGGFSSDAAYSMTPLGGTTHLGSSLTTPWTHIHTNINTAAGIAGAGASIEHAAFGLPTVFNMVGMNPSVAGTLALMTYGPQTAAMDRMLSNTYAYTKEGMPYIPVASYYNAASVGGSNYFFPGDISYLETGIVGTPPFATGYAVVQEVPESLVGVVGPAIAASSVITNPALAEYPSALAVNPYGGWTVGAAPTSAATTSAITTSTATTGGWGTVSGGWGTVSSGWGAGATTGGWGSGAVGGGIVGGGFVSGTGTSYGGSPGLGWGGGGGMASGGMAGGFSGGFGSGSSMGGGSYGGAPGAGFGGAPGGGGAAGGGAAGGGAGGGGAGGGGAGGGGAGGGGAGGGGAGGS